MRGKLRVTAGITGEKGGRDGFSLVILILSVGNGSLLGLGLHLVSSPAGQTVHHIHGVVGRTLQHEPARRLTVSSQSVVAEVSTSLPPSFQRNIPKEKFVEIQFSHFMDHFIFWTTSDYQALGYH